MTRPADPFTSTNARVVDSGAETARISREGQAALKSMGNLFGPTGRVQFKQYYGEEGGWRCGYTSQFGFHVRGRGATAIEALCDARRNRLSDDPGSLT
jgi:hypothetical protein